MPMQSPNSVVTEVAKLTNSLTSKDILNGKEKELGGDVRRKYGGQVLEMGYLFTVGQPCKRKRL